MARAKSFAVAGAVLLAAAGLSLALRAWSPLGAIINLLVLAVLLWYTFETRRMQQAATRQTEISALQAREMVHQRRLSVRPAFVARVRPINALTREQLAEIPNERINPREGVKVFEGLQITNIGNGTGVAISIEPIIGQVHGTSASLFPGLAFDTIPYLTPGESAFLPAITVHSGKRQTDCDYSKYLTEWFVKARGHIDLSFQGIESTRYTQRLMMDEGTCRPEKVEVAQDAE